MKDHDGNTRPSGEKNMEEKSPKNALLRVKEFVVYRVLRANDTPHRLSLGIAVGMFIAWTPTPGIQMLLVVLVASLLRANRLVGVPLVWLSNPFTLVPVYYPNYLVGEFLVGCCYNSPAVSYGELMKMLENFRSFSYIVVHFFDKELWQELAQLLLRLGLELWVGSIVVGLFLGVVSYFVSYKVIVWYRTRHPHGRHFQLTTSGEGHS